MSRSLRLRTRAASLGLVLTIAGGQLLIGTPAQADADPCLPVFELYAKDIVVYASGPSRSMFAGLVDDVCPDDERSFGPRLGHVSLPNGSSIQVERFEPDSGGAFQAFGPDGPIRIPKASGIGPASFGVWVSDGDTWIYKSIAFHVRLHVQVTSFNASPEPVRKGSPIKVAGVVTRLGFTSSGVAKYVPYAAHPVDVYFRPMNRFGYRKIGRTTTTSTGSFTRTFPATVDGCWWAHSAKTPYHIGRWARASDCVDVR